jgi:hypothetical protein
VTLHGHGPGDRKFILDRAKAMFFHPSLRNITLSCLNFEAEMDDALVKEKNKSTPLQSLVLIECNVNIHFLDTVLGLPKALKELSIGERLHIFECQPSMDPKERTSSSLFLTALQKQAHSLQRLNHVGGHLEFIPARERDPEGSAKLRSLTNLEHLELGLESHLNYYLRNNGFPPSLKTLKLLDAAISLNAGHDIRAMADIAFRSITSLVSECMPPSVHPDFAVHLHFSDHSIFRLFVIAHPAEQNRLLSTLFLDRPAIYKIATLLKSRNARFLVSRETFPSGTSYIPPYMYGEELPIEESMYDSDDYWRFNGIDYQVMDDEQLRAELSGKNLLKRCNTCKHRKISLENCRSTGNGSPCLPCTRLTIECRWEDESSDSEDEIDAAEEAEIQHIWYM